MKNESNNSEESKTNYNLTNETGNQNYRDEKIQNEIKMSNAYLRNVNSQEEKITDNLLKISCFMCLITISLSILITFLGKNMVKLRAIDDNIFMGFSYFSFTTTELYNITNDYSIFCLNKNCESSIDCPIDIKELIKMFDINCKDLMDFRNASLIYLISSGIAILFTLTVVISLTLFLLEKLSINTLEFIFFFTQFEIFFYFAGFSLYLVETKVLYDNRVHYGSQLFYNLFQIIFSVLNVVFYKYNRSYKQRIRARFFYESI